MLCGLLTPSGGSGTCLGYDILTQSALVKRHVGYIPQFFGLYKQLTVYENLLFMAELYGVLNRKNKVNNMLSQLELTSRKDQLAGSLSGGWKQRLSLAAALIHEPFLLLLDEPTANIDPHSRRDFWEIMHGLSAEGITVLLSSHNMDEVQRCNSIAYINDGRVLMSGKIRDIIDSVRLVTWKVQGKNLPLLAKQLHQTPGVEQVITFYDALHVSGRNQADLDNGIKPFLNNPNFNWELIQASLDDTFVWLSNPSLNRKDT